MALKSAPKHRQHILEGTARSLRGRMTHNTLHVYASEFCHESPWIVGDAAALVRLRNAIERALKEGAAVCDSFTNDGEGFRLFVKVVEDLDTFQILALPYAETNWKGVHPCSLDPEEYKTLARLP